jgi:hypothetical protein
MSFFVVVDGTQNGQIKKYQEYSTRIEADAHIARVLPNYPKAFVVDNPGTYYTDHCTVDMDAQTFVYETAEHDAEKFTHTVLGEIRRLEGMVTARRIRDAMVSDEGKAWVANIEDKIKVERDKL